MRRSVCLVALAASSLVPLPARGEADPYTTRIELSDPGAGARTEITFSFRAAGEVVEKIDVMEIDLPAGASVDAAAFRRSCTVETHGPEAGHACASSFRDARVGEGEMTVDMLGRHTVSADAYRIQGGPEGANLVFFFPADQVFGVGPQSIFGSVTLDGSDPPRIRISEIQSQLALPFGATAELEKGRFTFAGEAGSPAFSMPPGVPAADAEFRTVLRWGGGSQRQRVRAQAAR